MSINLRLKKVLESKGLKIKEVAELCDIPYRTLQNYLLGEREPSAKALSTIGTQLGVSLDWLLTGEGQMYKNAPPPEQQLQALTPKERALLELFKELNDKDQREIYQDAEQKKHMSDLERELKELKSIVEQQKNVG